MSATSDNARLETFCDGVFAIALTLLILEIKIPHHSEVNTVPELWHEIVKEWPSWFGFVLSFTIILCAWVAHHDIFKMLGKAGYPFIFSNGLLLLSVVSLPYSTGLMAEFLMTDLVKPAITFYCFSIFIHSIGWFFFHNTAIRLIKDGATRQVYTKMMIVNNRYAMALYLSLSILSFWIPYISMTIMTLSWIAWLILILRMKPKE